MTVNAAAGNSYSSAYSNYTGKGKPYASDPDAGTVSEPASYPLDPGRRLSRQPGRPALPQPTATEQIAYRQPPWPVKGAGRAQACVDIPEGDIHASSTPVSVAARPSTSSPLGTPVTSPTSIVLEDSGEVRTAATGARR